MVFKVAVILGIRPDFIRTSEVLRLLEVHENVDLSIIHTGQHYDRNLNDIFFKEMDIPKVTHQLKTAGKNHNEQHSKLIMQLSDVLEEIRPDVCVFLGDANAVIGCIAPLKLGIPIAHIEAGMRSYDWRMPEERNRVIIDRVSDVLYVYQHDYALQLVQEGVDPTKIVVTGNVIVDVIKKHREKFKWPVDYVTDFLPAEVFYKELDFNGTQLKKGQFALMTLHRNEHMNRPIAKKIIKEIGYATQKRNLPVILIEMPRLKALRIKYPENFIVSPPLGFFEFGRLEANAAIEYTDSGTNQESASIFGTPCVVTRTCTERPECRDCGTTVLSGMDNIEDATELVLSQQRNKDFTLGDGKASERIVKDLIKRFSDSHMPVSFRERHFRIL